MSRRLDIGICAYFETGKLVAAVEALKKHCTTDWRLLIVDNTCDADGGKMRKHIERLCADPRITAQAMDHNIGYAGAVNMILDWSRTEYTAYLDHDAYVQTHGWDELMAKQLDMFHELGVVFPGTGAYPINRGAYTECMWSPGFCWMISRLCMADLRADGKTANGDVMDTTLGHQEEADLALRVRLAGYKCGAVPAVSVHHDATATNNPASLERINRGVRNWVDKWARYFGGKNLGYHSPNVLRWEDWNALYFEDFWKQHPKLQGLNDNPEVVNLGGVEYDLIRVPRLKGFYRGRII